WIGVAGSRARALRSRRRPRIPRGVEPAEQGAVRTARLRRHRCHPGRVVTAHVAHGARGADVTTDHLGGRFEECDLLDGFNDWYRGVIVNKLEGLSLDDATRVMTPSGLSPLNIVGHLAACEIGWFFEKFGGGEIDPFWGCTASSSCTVTRPSSR